MTRHGHPTVQIPQVFTAALAASVYICVAQRLGAYVVAADYLDKAGNVDWAELRFGCFPLVLVVLWTAKNSIDEFKSFTRDPGDAFSLGWTILFSTSAYIVLATTASVLFVGVKPVWGLFLFFVVCSLWSWSSVYRYSNAQGIDLEKHERRQMWAVAYPVQAAAMFILTLETPVELTSLLVLLSLGMFAWDAWQSKTFVSSHSAGA